MVEHDNRQIAKKYAEYLTRDELRRYTANKVRQYVVGRPTIFDGAIGSGQLEQYVNAIKIYAVEIQNSACRALSENFKNVDVENKSFFNYDRADVLVDCVIMNPPFSLSFKELSEEEQKNIQSDFESTKIIKIVWFYAD